MKGITHQEARVLLKKYGENILPRQKKSTQLEILIRQFKSPLIYVLIFATGVTTFLQDFADTLVIAAAVIINTILGYYQESKAETSLEALNSMLDPSARVVRDGRRQKIDMRHLVPGDLVIVGSGDKVPADGVLVESVSLTVSEAMLTGESIPVGKSTYRRRIDINDLAKIEDRYKVYMGTIVLTGRASFLVVKTGKKTRMGSIALSLASVSDERTPLQRRLERMAQVLVYMVTAVSIGVFVTGVIFGKSLTEMFTISVAIAVAAIPEGVVVTMTVILAIGMQRILKRKALVRKLIAAETLGSVTVIATDKTGTLTEGVMRVCQTDIVNKSGVVAASVFANNLEDPLEVALWEWVKHQGIDPQQMADENRRQKEIPFDSVAKYMSVVVSGVNYVKGAPEVVLKMCQMSESKRRQIHTKFHQWSLKGLRVIGLAYGKKKLQWAGLVGIEDPIRETVAETFLRCRRAGIKVIMITGDYEGTAKAVWESIGGKKFGDKHEVVDGAQLANMNDEELLARVGHVEVFARVSPDQKLRIVTALQKHGEVLALIGDGVNDAPAIKQANIGIVVGEASDVAKETADMVLLDSNFKTILSAIEEGRAMLDNIKKVILYLLSDSFSEVVLVVLSLFAGIPLPLTAAQILWINLITDGFPNLALTVEPKEKGLMSRPPVNPETSLMTRQMKLLILIVSVITGLSSLLLFIHYYNVSTLDHARTVVFMLQGIDSLFYVFSTRSLHHPLWKFKQLSNPFLLVAVVAAFLMQIVAVYHPFFQNFLHTVPLGLSEWIHITLILFIIISLIEGIKLSLIPNLRISTA